ncbi:hypothetical protein UCRNP2_745 [Neofusicoccum parvum UCRNP2]|uniref:Uncharacterized protein n=1 Tax=Botryosphaeria parva (strain UCR-NP2) TaxID=1287680 RepID=R1GLA1_BOTPV|nr:hypothetical protein UCRNP2_745 [Neofusicoccum parvum UCRNP2]
MLFPSNTASPEPTAAKISDKRRLDPSIAHAALSTADAPVDINADRFSSSSPPFLNRSPKPEGSRQLATNTQEPESNGPDTNNNWADAAISAAAEAIDSHKVEIPDGVREPSTESGWEQMRDGNPLGVEAEVAGDSDMVMEAPGTEDGGSPATTGNVDTGTEGMSGDVESRSSGNPFVLVDDDEERSIEIAPFTKPTATLAASPILTPNEPVAQRTRPAEPSKPNIGATRANQQPTDLEAAPVHNPFDEIYGPGSGINATVEVAETEHDDQSQVSSSMKRKCHSNAAQSIAVEVDLTPVTPGEVFEAEGSPGMSHVIGDGSADSPVMLDSDDEGDGDGGGPKSNPASA